MCINIVILEDCISRNIDVVLWLLNVLGFKVVVWDFFGDNIMCNIEK